MRIITRQMLADGAAKRYAKAYRAYPDRVLKTEQLRALPAPVDPGAVDSIIGNSSWTRVPKCDECSAEELPAVIEMGEEPDYESNTANLCVSCLQKALAALGSA